MKKKATHGGARTGAGRKPLPPEDRRQKYTVWLTDAEAEFLTATLGGISEGVQQLLRAKLSRRQAS